jgi:hypothetical protein
MHDEDIVDPIPCPDAFREGGESASYSQAALLLALGIALKPKYAGLLQTLRDPAPFPLPELRPVEEPVPEARFDRVLEEARRQALEAEADELQWRAAEDLYRRPAEYGNADGALRLLAASLVGPDELVRVAAAVSTLDLVDTSYAATWTLVTAAMRSPSALVRAIATTGLMRNDHSLRTWRWLVWKVHQRVREATARFWQSRDVPAVTRVRSTDDVTCIVHGTLFVPVGRHLEEWWKPGTGDFHEYLRKGPRPNVYSGPDYYRWSGGWNDFARSEAVQNLSAWMRAHGQSELDLFAHSHGANVAMLASHHVKIRQLVLLSCPVHWGLYQPDFSKVSDVVSFRVRWDLVIMADRGDQRFSHQQIREHVLPLWYGAHESARRSSTWRSQDLVKHLHVPGGSKTVVSAAAPPSQDRVAPTFEYRFDIKGPHDRAFAFAQAMRGQPGIQSASVPIVEFKNSRPRDRYAVFITARQELQMAWVRQVAEQSNAEILGGESR